jgi:hypothetical protein
MLQIDVFEDKTVCCLHRFHGGCEQLSNYFFVLRVCVCVRARAHVHVCVCVCED